ncbi:CPBP family glutamic-type intramembrane protease [Streptomyces sp. NPDC041068]|uniref:CPBP family glutamic-type intramembrane protease n=1 Tax=Streptomyces sp. NPDC041068 TaxID=3155130 RepID=UPI0033FC9CBB
MHHAPIPCTTRPPSRPRAAVPLLLGGWLLAFGLSSTIATWILFTGTTETLPKPLAAALPVTVVTAFAVAAAQLAAAVALLRLSPAELGLARPRPLPGGWPGAAALGYAAAWTGFQFLGLFPSPDGAYGAPQSSGWELVWNLNAALVEETVLFALPLAVMARRGLTWPVQLAVLVVLRLPHHMYYGLGATVTVAVWMAGWLYVYRRTGAIWPLMLAHLAYNSAHAAYLPPAAGALLGLTTLAFAAVTALRWARPKS